MNISDKLLTFSLERQRNVLFLSLFNKVYHAAEILPLPKTALHFEVFYKASLQHGSDRAESFCIAGHQENQHG